jgi:Lrp/AsnC family leucine-responsive transcriptional regulator
MVISESSKNFKSIVDHSLSTPEVLECHSITGDGSHILKIRTENTTTLEKLLSKIQAWPGVKSTKSSIVLTSHKETNILELKHHFKNQ